jgi:hypothetical protein
MNIDKRLIRKDSLEKLFDILKQNSKTVFLKLQLVTFRPPSLQKRLHFPGLKNYWIIPNTAEEYRLKKLILTVYLILLFGEPDHVTQWASAS